MYEIGAADVSSNMLKNLVHEESTGKDVANYMTCANNGLNVLAVAMGKFTAIFKINMQTKKLEELQKFETDFSPIDACTNTLRWSSDNGGLAAGGEDKLVRLYKVAAPNDFKSPLKMVCELGGGHHEAINDIDISPNKTLLVSSGNDSQACVYDLRKKALVKKLTFRDKEYRDARGNTDDSNFTIRGCVFSGSSIFLLASKVRYKSFIVEFSINPSSTGSISFVPSSVVYVHDNGGTGLNLSPDGSQFAVTTNDGFIKIVEKDSSKVVLA